MTAFDLHQRILDDCCDVVHSFIQIADERARAFMDKHCEKRNAWPRAAVAIPEGYRWRCETSDSPSEIFRVLKEKEIRRFGEYHTRRLVLGVWERLTGETP